MFLLGLLVRKKTGRWKIPFFFGWMLKVDFWLVFVGFNKRKKGGNIKDLLQKSYPNWLEMVRESQRSTRKNHPFWTGRCCCNGMLAFRDFCFFAAFQHGIWHGIAGDVLFVCKKKCLTSKPKSFAVMKYETCFL